MIDIATLTGACMVALGENTAGLFGNSTSLQKSIENAGEEVEERVWPV